MDKRLTIVSLFFSIMLIITFSSNNIVTIITSDASASLNTTIQESNISNSQNARNLTPVTATPQGNVTFDRILAADITSELIGNFIIIVAILIGGIALLLVAPLIYSMRKSNSKDTAQSRSRDLYRLLVAIGVTFTVVLIIVYLNTLALTLIATGGVTETIIEIEENFLTIIGTAFASLIAFYFGSRGTQASNAGTRGTQASNGERTTPTATGPGPAPQTTLEVIGINPIEGTVGVEVDSPVTATFSTSIRSSTINPNTFSVKDANGNPVQGKITLTDNNTTIRFNPVSPFNRDNRYTVTITKGILDISGASLVADKEWYFTTLV